MPAVSASTRALVVTAANGFCEYCRYPEEFNAGRFAVDHITPVSKGGLDVPENLALACRNCNERKPDAVEGYDPATGESAALFHPRRERWHDHFTWSEDFRIVLGLTPTGRATIDRLHTNHLGVLRQREVLRELGRHPEPD